MNTTSKPWDHLPNAKHINRIVDRIADSRKHYRDIWSSAWYKCSDLVGHELRYRAWNEAEAKCKEMGRWDIWKDDDTPSIGVILALIAYDNCAHYLEYTSQELTTVALLGVRPAVLLLQIVMHFEEIAKISHR